MDINDLIKIKEEKSKDQWWLESEKLVIDKYGKLFQPGNLIDLTKDEFKSFLLIKNNKHWEGIHRQSNLITADMDALKKYLKYLLDENISLKIRLDNLLSNNNYKIKGLGRAVLTPILLVVYPDKYGVWNSKSESALSKLGLLPGFLPKNTFVDKYIQVNEQLNDLKNQLRVSLWQLDGLLGELAGNGPFNSEESEVKELDEVVRDNGIDAAADFGKEKYLEDCLIKYWDKTEFGTKYELIFNEGDIESQQYPTDTGRIDILARTNDQSEYIVIELKKGHSSDIVIGQIQRYIAWVKKNIGQGKIVKGAIISFSVDENLKLALSESASDIKLYTYTLDISIKEHKSLN